MPPKKKRGGLNQVGSAVKVSTRSSKKPIMNVEEGTGNVNESKMPKVAAKAKPRRGKGGSRVRARKGVARKKKSEVMSVQLDQNNSLEVEITPSNDQETLEVLEPVEPIHGNGAEAGMETTEMQSTEPEACQLTEQLEKLNVEEVQPVEPTNDLSNLETQIVELDSCEAFTVEYITEELVPVAANTEVVIEEEIPANCADKEAHDDPKPEDIDLPPLATSPSQVDNPAQEEPKDVKPEDIKDETIEEALAAICGAKPETQPAKTKKKPQKRETKKAAPRKRPPPKAKPAKKEPNDKTEEVRRSSRIKSINVLKQRSKGHGLVKTVKFAQDVDSGTESATAPVPEAEKFEPVAAPATEADNKPVKVKSRWRRSSELEMNVLTPAAVVLETCGDSEKIAEASEVLNNKQKMAIDQAEVEARLKQFVHLKENLYLTDRLGCKEAKKMTCDCFLTQEEIDRGELGCGEDCLNRLLMIECGSLCPIGDRCTNKKFQKNQFAPVEVFKTDKKGLGLRAAANIPYGEFILEYVGEVLDHEEFDARADGYSHDKNRHYYFMSLRADAIIDATLKGNISRFINHSCDPNAETQKWTVNGELRIGFFSTRTILAGEEITFDYRFQRYGKEAQKCYCEAAICRGWLGEEPEDEDDEDEEDDEEDAEEGEEQLKEGAEVKTDEAVEQLSVAKEEKVEDGAQKPPKKEKKKRAPKKKPRKDIFEDLDQLDDEIEMLITTGLKNQAHTLKLSRLMVRAKEPAQRTKLLRVLRRGELPCRRLFLDYHGLRLMHGYMTEAQDLAKTDKKYESLRLEMLQTLATLPIPNKTMLQDSKVLPTVEKWSFGKQDDLPVDSNSSSPQTDQDANQPPHVDNNTKEEAVVEEANMETQEENEIRKSVAMDYQGEGETSGFSNTHGKELADEISAIFQEDTEVCSPSMELKTAKTEPKAEPCEEPNYQEEITALAVKLLEEWSNLKEVFKIPKKERIEQMKEHEREANRGYIAGLGLEQDAEKKNESRYRILKRYRSLNNMDTLSNRKNVKLEDRTIANFPKLGKFERRKMFALQVEQREEERRRKQREMWRQHEQHCILLGTDPRLTAPFDPNRGYQCIWNPQIGQWQNYPLQNPNMIFNPQNAMNMQPNNPTYPFMQSNLHATAMIPGPVNPMHPLPSLPYQEEAKKEEDYSQVKFMGPIPPPVKLPPKWKCAKDKYGRPYYYHVKIRKSQWEPPPPALPQEDLEFSSETTSSSDTSSLSSDTSSDDSDSEEDVDDSKLLLEVRRQMDKQTKAKSVANPIVKTEEIQTSPDEKDDKEDDKSETSDPVADDEDGQEPTKDAVKEEKPQPGNKKRRAGLVHEIIISPRTEEDRLQFREDLKRFKLNKEKLKKEKELMQQNKNKHVKEKRYKNTVKLKMKEMGDSNSESGKKIKETFRSNMATVVVSVLNAYRKPDCKEGRITNTDEFKHLARKLTHFVMLKEMKHIEKIEDLVCTENVKAKAKEYIRKYMSKFGEIYQKRNDEPDF